mmetsp:Transcript_13995/g.52290  ORF Transcript_13995/g.52290 Transcript_13995/m.52290 type:complete len:83 (-) Transcript_13995:3551-3799(-)
MRPSRQIYMGGMQPQGMDGSYSQMGGSAGGQDPFLSGRGAPPGMDAAQMSRMESGGMSVGASCQRGSFRSRRLLIETALAAH